MENGSWTQHNDIRYTLLPHETLFPDIPRLELSPDDKIHLRL